jgi:hypothetical protein
VQGDAFGGGVSHAAEAGFENDGGDQAGDVQPLDMLCLQS